MGHTRSSQSVIVFANRYLEGFPTADILPSSRFSEFSPAPATSLQRRQVTTAESAAPNLARIQHLGTESVQQNRSPFAVEFPLLSKGFCTY
jgi:hypothetical protein